MKAINFKDFALFLRQMGEGVMHGNWHKHQIFTALHKTI
jgi:hypothetical protein